MFEELAAAADQQGRNTPTDDRRLAVDRGRALPPEVREPMTGSTVTERGSEGKAIAPFVAQDPYRELPAGAKRVDFYVPSYVQAGGRVPA